MSSSSSSTFEPGKPSLALLACCAPGLEPVLGAELTELGFTAQRTERGGVAFSTDRAGMMRANLRLGTALQVLWRIARFNAHDFRELEKRLAHVPFAALLPRGAQLRVRAFSRRSRLYHTGALAQRVQDAVQSAVPISPDGPILTLVLRLDRDRATLALDTSGEPLYRRGYRVASGPAPLRADLACALLRVSGYDGSRPLFDAMTGTGTLAIEALRLSRGCLPKAQRAFAFEQLPDHERDLLESQREPSTGRTDAAPIVARDRSPAAIARAQRNAEHAGARDAILWEVGSLSDTSVVDSLPPPLLVANPPYGQRLGDAKKLERLYAALGRRAEQLHAQLAFLTSSARLAARTGGRAKSVLLTDAGGLKVRFYLSPPAPARSHDHD